MDINTPTIDVVLGQYSDLFMLLAAMVYASAFIAFAWDLAKSSKLIQEIDAATVASEKKLLVAAGSVQTPAADSTSNALVNDAMTYTVASRSAVLLRLPSL